MSRQAHRPLRSRLIVIIAASLSAILVAAAALLYTPDQPRAALERKYPAGYLSVAGIRLRLRDTGPRDAPALIMLHGFGASLQTWDGWSDILSQNFRVVRFDLPGFGLTGPDPANDYSDARAMRILAALMDRLGLASATLIGNSMGGRIAWMFASLHPERVDRLVLISPDGFASPGIAYGKRQAVPPVVRLLPYVMPRSLLRSSLAPAYANPALLTDATVTRYYDLMLAPGTRAAIVARTGQTMIEDPVPMLRRVRAPTLLVWGEKDAMIPFGNASDYLREIPSARLAALPDLGHVPFEEAPRRSLAPVLVFLQTPREALVPSKPALH